MQSTDKMHNKNVEKHRNLIFDAAEFLWHHPETGYKEWKTQEYLAAAFQKLGYALTFAGDIPGFYTEIDTGRPGPTLLMMGEMDAVCVASHPDADPETGAVHACGHCVQVTGLLGAAAALKEPGALDKMCGKIRLMVLPAEEAIEIEYREALRRKGIIRFFGGKQEFIARSYMDGCDLCVMIHTTSEGEPGTARVDWGANGFLIEKITFCGKSAHAATACRGINALYAANAAMTAINALRETFREEDRVRVHPIITKGGTVVNAVPEDVTMETYVRAASIEAMLRESEKVNRAVAGAALSMGANAKIAVRPGYLPQTYTQKMREAAFEAALRATGKAHMDSEWRGDSSDIGDLTALLPTAYFHIAGAKGTAHGNDYDVSDTENLCVGSAKVLVAFAQLMLGDGAARAKEVIADYTPLYRSREAYLAAMEGMDYDVTCVDYRKNGAAEVRWKKQETDTPVL